MKNVQLIDRILDLSDAAVMDRCMILIPSKQNNISSVPAAECLTFVN